MIDPIADNDSSVPDSLYQSGIQSPIAGPSSAPDHPLLLLRDLPDSITSGIRSRSRSPLVRYSCSTSDEDQQPDQPDLPGRPRSRSRSPLNRQHMQPIRSSTPISDRIGASATEVSL